MSAELFPYFNRATNSNGSPLSGARWFFYASGTTTPQAVYTDDTLGTPHAHPVVSDSSGLFAPIYFDASLEYRGILQDGAGVEILDVDPINASVLAQLASTATGNGAALVGFKPEGASATASTVEAQLDRLARFYPEDFGASGNGTIGGGGANDAAAINACDVAAAAAGGTVVFRNSYRVESQLLMSANWHFEGGTIIRDWTSAAGTIDKDESATIKGRGNDALDAFYIDPGPYAPVGELANLSLTGEGVIRMSTSARAYYDANSSSHACQIYMLCDNFRLDGDIRIGLGGNDWTITYGGDNSFWRGFQIYSETGDAFVFEDGLHVLYGHNGRIYGVNIESGDDCISLNSNLNLAISNWVITAPTLFSHVAFGIKIAQQRTGATAAYGAITQYIEQILVDGARWRMPRASEKSRNGFARIDASGTGTGLIRDCRIINFDANDAENNGLPTGYTTGVAALSFAGPATDCFIQGRIANPSQEAAQINAAVRCGIEVVCDTAPNWTNGSSVRALDIRGACSNCWIDGDVKGGNAGGGTKFGALSVAQDSTAVTGFYSNRLILRDTPASSPAVSLNAAADGFTVTEQFSAYAESGATLTQAVQSTAIPINIRGYGGDVARVLTTATTPTELNVEFRPGQQILATVSSGGFVYFGGGEYAVTPEGDVADTLTTISGGRKGAEIRIKNAATDPTTATLAITSAGNIAVGATRTISSALGFLDLYFDGSSWQEGRFVA